MSDASLNQYVRISCPGLSDGGTRRHSDHAARASLLCGCRMAISDEKLTCSKHFPAKSSARPPKDVWISYAFGGLEPTVAQPPLPLQLFFALQPLSLALHPPLPLHSFLPLQECLSLSASLKPAVAT
jgi:hypothetical protein